MVVNNQVITDKNWSKWVDKQNTCQADLDEISVYTYVCIYDYSQCILRKHLGGWTCSEWMIQVKITYETPVTHTPEKTDSDTKSRNWKDHNGIEDRLHKLHSFIKKYDLIDLAAAFRRGM